MRYDSRLNVYIISEDELGNYSVDALNRFGKKVILDVNSTKNLSAKMFATIKNQNVEIRVRGAYGDKRRIEYWTKRNLENPNVRRGNRKIQGVTYYEDSNIYTISEMTQIMRKIAEIESGIMPSWSKIKKALYVYDRLREEIIYHPEYETQDSYDIRTLRGLISSKSVCAGFAVIFKEFMDRLDIDCHYVEGATNEADAKKGHTRHAWNILDIDGILLPIDLTWDAARYREGQTDSFSFFSNVDEFRRKHFPHEIETVRDYSKLYGLKRRFVEETIKSFKKKKDYSESVISIRTVDGEVVYVTQLEQIKKPVEKDRNVYRYVVAKKDENGNFVDYRMVYASTNLLKVKKALEWKKIDSDSFITKGVTELFSYSNIDRARVRGSSYIGQVVKSNNVSGYTIENERKYRVMYPDKAKEFVRNDGVHYLVGETPKTDIVRGNPVVSGYVGSFSDDGFREYKVCSDKSLFDESVHGIENGFFDKSYLDARVRYAGGYLGYLNEHGRVTTTKELAEYFDIKNAGNFDREDLVTPEMVYNPKFSSVVDFSTLREAVVNYDIRYSDDFMESHVVDRTTGEEVTDEESITICKFAHMWRSATDFYRTDLEEIPGITCAFDESSALAYDYIFNSCCRDLEVNGKIDFDRLSDDDMVNQGYVRHFDMNSIIYPIVHNPVRRKLLYDFCNMQVENYGNQRTAMKAERFEERKISGELNAMLSELDSLNAVGKSSVYSETSEKK